MANDLVNKLEGLRARFDAPYSPSDKRLIESLYYAILGKMFAPTSCQNCYHDAVIEMSLFMKNGYTMAQEKRYILKAGAIICNPEIDNGKVYTNVNITDDVAERYLLLFPDKINLFARADKTPKTPSEAQKRPTIDDERPSGTTTRQKRKSAPRVK